MEDFPHGRFLNDVNNTSAGASRVDKTANTYSRMPVQLDHLIQQPSEPFSPRPQLRLPTVAEASDDDPQYVNWRLCTSRRQL